MGQTPAQEPPVTKLVPEEEGMVEGRLGVVDWGLGEGRLVEGILGEGILMA